MKEDQARQIFGEAGGHRERKDKVANNGKEKDNSIEKEAKMKKRKHEQKKSS